jgi:hypothetical protein
VNDEPEVGVHYGDSQPPIDYLSFLYSIFAIHVCGIVGILVPQLMSAAASTCRSSSRA